MQYSDFSKIAEGYKVLFVGEGAIKPRDFALLANLRRNFKKKVFLVVNSHWPLARYRDWLTIRGFRQGEHYDEILTSAQVARDAILSGHIQLPGKRYSVFGKADSQSSDTVPPALKGLDLQVSSPFEADFLVSGEPWLNDHFVKHDDEVKPFIETYVKTGCPMLCMNPEEWAKKGGKYVMEAGRIAKLYKSMKGKVIIYGKPEEQVYKRAMEALGDGYTEQDILAVEFSVTGLLGAMAFGLDTCLVTEGQVEHRVRKHSWGDLNMKDLAQYIAAKNCHEPTYVVPSIS